MKPDDQAIEMWKPDSRRCALGRFYPRAPQFICCFLVGLVALSGGAVVASSAESYAPAGLRYDPARTFAVELPANAPTGEASIREHAIAWHPGTHKYYLVADVVPLSHPHHPNTYDTDLHLWSSFNLAVWTYHGVVVPKGIPGQTYDGHGVASPAGMTCFNGKLYVAFSARKTTTYTERSIGLAWSGDDPERLPWTKTLQPISDLPGEDDDSGLVAIPGDDRLHLYHRATGGYRIVHTASRTPEAPNSWPPAKDVTQRPGGVRAQELTGVVWVDGAVHLFVIEHFEKGPLRIAHVQSRQPEAMFEPVDPRRRYIEPQPRNLAYGGHLTPVVREGRFEAFFWTVFQSGKRYGLLGHPTPRDSTP